jgi:hypothetical protein
MIKSDIEILTFDELRNFLDLTGNQLNALIGNGLPYISLGDKKVFLASSVKIFFGRIEDRIKPTYPPERGADGEKSEKKMLPNL